MALANAWNILFILATHSFLSEWAEHKNALLHSVVNFVQVPELDENHKQWYFFPQKMCLPVYFHSVPYNSYLYVHYSD